MKNVRMLFSTEIQTYVPTYIQIRQHTERAICTVLRFTEEEMKQMQVGRELDDDDDDDADIACSCGPID